VDALPDIEIDEAPTAEGTRLVRVGGGATWGEVATELGRHGLAISSGDTRSVGVGGLTLGAGIRFDFLAHPLAGVVHASITLNDTAGLPKLVRAFRDVMRAAQRELNGSLARTPAMGPQMPSRIMIEAAWAGTDDVEAGIALAPLLALPQVVSSEVNPVAYLDLLQERHRPACRCRPSSTRTAVSSRWMTTWSTPLWPQLTLPGPRCSSCAGWAGPSVTSTPTRRPSPSAARRPSS
jgi:hypothetical protein